MKLTYAKLGLPKLYPVNKVLAQQAKCLQLVCIEVDRNVGVFKYKCVLQVAYDDNSFDNILLV